MKLKCRDLLKGWLVLLPVLAGQALAGEPLPPAPAGEWLKVDIDGATCRDGSQANLSVKYSDSSANVMIYLEGGGACFNATTCLANPSSAILTRPLSIGIFADRPDNPVADWNKIYVPYCTGDVFSGTRKGVDIPDGPSNQNFTGFTNLTKMLQRIVPTFPKAEKVLLTGISAGGFGAIFNYDQTATAFGDIPVILLDDSGVPFSDDYLAPCLQRKWREIWGWEDSLPKDCAACFQPDGAGVINSTAYMYEKWPEARLGFVTSQGDAVIRTFYGYGNNDCQVLVPNMPAEEFKAGLQDLQDNYSQPNMTSFIVEGQMHTHIMLGFYSTEVNGQPLNEWTRDLINGTAVNQIPPE